MKDQEERSVAERELLVMIRGRLPELEGLLGKASSHAHYEDGIYRFYHQSWKVYSIQSLTSEIVAALRSLAPGQPLNEWFLKIVSEGTGRRFSSESNENWPAETRPLLEAFFHAILPRDDRPLRPRTGRASRNAAERVGRGSLSVQPALKAGVHRMVEAARAEVPLVRRSVHVVWTI